LLRWKNPQGAMVSPMEFVPIMEETKMILPLGK
jgi:Predicted signal transduction protein containing sensor and EAL domains